MILYLNHVIFESKWTKRPTSFFWQVLHKKRKKENIFHLFLAPEKAFSYNRKVLIFLFFFHENICCEYPLEAPHGGASNEYPQYMFFVEK